MKMVVVEFSGVSLLLIELTNGFLLSWELVERKELSQYNWQIYL